MRRFAVLLAVSAGLALPGRPAAAQGPSFVDVALAPEEITVGDRVEAKLTLVWDGEKPVSTPRFPAWEGAWGRAEVLEVGEVEAVAAAGGGRRIYSQKLVLTAFETGDFELPPRTVTVVLDEGTVDVATREGVRFTVESVLPEESGDESRELEPRPAAPLAALPEDRRFLWTGASLAGLSLVAALLLARNARRAAAAPAAPPPPRRPPLEELLEALDRVDAEAGPEPVHTALSQALRRFLGRSLGFNALESTTSEIRRTLSFGPLNDDLELTAVDVLRDCDEVKYARLEPAPAVVAERLVLTRDLAHEIDRLLRPPEPPGEEP